jgi:hypothetical protein
MFKGSNDKEDPDKHCYGGSKDNVYIPVSFETYDRIRNTKYDYKVNREEFFVTVNKNIKIEIIQNDITREKVNTIVNGSNSKMLLGGGLAGAIKKAGGPEIQ